MGVHEACTAAVWWPGKALNMSAASQGRREYIMKPEADPLFTEEMNAIEETKASWTEKLFSFYAKFKDSKQYFNHIRDNMSSVKELWAKLLEYEPEYHAKLKAFQPRRYASAEERREMRAQRRAMRVR
jgi:hypothetical protein